MSTTMQSVSDRITSCPACYPYSKSSQTERVNQVTQARRPASPTNRTRKKPVVQAYLGPIIRQQLFELSFCKQPLSGKLAFGVESVPISLEVSALFFCWRVGPDSKASE